MVDPTRDEIAAKCEDFERDIRISLWNGMSKSGVSQDFATIYIRAIMAEECMKRALAAYEGALKAHLEAQGG